MNWYERYYQALGRGRPFHITGWDKAAMLFTFVSHCILIDTGSFQK